MNFFMFPDTVPVDGMLREVEAKPQFWKFDTRRQDNIPVQRETNAINLRVSIPEKDIDTIHWQEAKDHSLYDFYPSCRKFLDKFIQDYGGVMGRVAIVKLPLGNQVYPHIDEGTYYSLRDRFHLVITGEYKYVVEDEEKIFKEGQLWWFDNQKMHYSQTIGTKDRIAIIFDVKNSQWRNKFSLTT